MQRIALIDDTGTVTNVAIFPDDWTGDTWDDYQAIAAPDEVGPGWTYADGTFTAPPVEQLTSDRTTISLTETALVTYRNTYADTPAEVTFTVNGASEAVALTEGTAELVITPTEIGHIEVSVDQPVPSIAITVQEA